MTSHGSPGALLQHAIGNLNRVRAAALEMERVPLDDGARIVSLIAERDPHAFEPAALRWTTRLISERRDVTLEHLAIAVDAFEQMREAPQLAVERRRALL